jgi:membrane protein DedA with SNARE-associated domain
VWLFRFLLHFHGPAAYVGVLFVLITCGLGVPLPEDVPLITGGYLASRGGSLPAMILVGLAGILIGDSIIFRFGQTYGEKLLETRLGRHIPGEKVQRCVHLFEKHGPKFIMVARFVPGLRAVTYFVAGTTGVPYWKFILYDGIAACVSAPVWVATGWWAGKNHMLPKAWRWASQANTWILIFIGVLVVSWLVYGFFRRRARRQRGQPLQTPLPTLRAVGGGADHRT